jgi:general secretion pathway protein F
MQLADLTLLTQQLATLLEAGLPLDECLQGVIEQTEKSHVKQILTGVRAKIIEGHTLAYAMEQFPSSFPELYCATIAAGEQTGKLHVVLNRLAEYAENQQLMRQKISQALIYPTLMTLVSIGIVSFLLIYVVPKIIHVFTDSGQALPAATQILIAASSFLGDYGLYMLVAIVAGLIIFFRMLKKEWFKYKWHKLLLRLPLFGYAIRTINTARYARTFGILFAAGVSVLEAMKVAAKLITNLPMRKSIGEAGNRVKEGSNINLSLKQTNYFPPMSIHLIASGENSGTLGHMLEKTANSQERDVSRLIETILNLFEPLIILVMGSIVLFIVLAILLPIFQLDQISG